MGPILNLPFLKKPSSSQEPPAASSTQAPLPPEDETRLKLYKLIIERYREEIEAHESKSVADLKNLIKPRNEKTIEIRDSILETFRPYIYEEHFLPAAKMCASYISSFRTISPPVSFWLEFYEMRELMAGDEIDKSMLLCSLLRSIGSENAKVLVTDSKNSYVVFDSGGRHYLIDHSKAELAEFPGWQECLSAVKGKPIYSFNDKEYEDFSEPD